MINFVSKEKNINQQVEKIRKLGMMLTTVVLVAYLVGMAGVLGWWFVMNRKGEQVSVEVITLTSEVAKLSEAEVLARKLEERSKMVTAYLDGRGNTGEVAEMLAGEQLQATGWEYKGVGGQKIRVASGDVLEVKDYIDRLTQKYNNVRLVEVEWKLEDGWVATVEIHGRKT